MLYTNLKHIETVDEYNKTTSEYENVMIICGRMDPMSIQLFSVAEEISKAYRHIKFFDLEFDNPHTQQILRNSIAERSMSSPFIVSFKKGKVVNVARGLKNKEQFKGMVDSIFLSCD
jgi:thioredoxin 1